MSDDSLDIDCEDHGKGIAAVVCGHLVNNVGSQLGFIENSSIPGDLQGWCYACEHVYKQEQDKTDKFRKFTDTVVVCEQCYAKTKAHHEIKT